MEDITSAFAALSEANKELVNACIDKLIREQREHDIRGSKSVYISPELGGKESI